MVSSSVSNKRYTYIHESESNSTREAIDIHHVIINGGRATSYARRRGIGFFLVLLASSMYFFLGKDNPVRTLSWGCLLSGFLVMLQSRKFVNKESVIIMPTFGIQLETQYLSGKTVSRFIPIGKILKPVLVECVTPITCYWSLSLFLRGEEQLTLVFKELRPPLKMLVPIWKALCAAIGTDHQSETIVEEEHDVSS
ncbi:GPI-GlcNAc transferase complex PIG-H component conserved domain [Arabidopsis thaliana x Arabidopsis arenosa]|uniref:GPI-GlcNAc transferase complex PIG-H component conserved domain n=1 Tax=Arabidopsis thaliana x Arabidopsis arenosa TaxID=1240361 RepID=A0A8T1Y125_9BRAS|nr:GPI-GlcNAc transferase complex PIG-H component conserved domain [Arabidopsis thaliana x Arabidopsis arenosa]